MLTRLRLENFKSWKNTGNIALKPITGIFGANSSGKTSLIQSLLLLKQTADSSDRGIVFHFGDDRTPVDLGDFESVVHGHDSNNPMRVSLDWKTQRPMRIRGLDSGSEVVRSDRIGFDVVSRGITSQSTKSPIVDQMLYRVGDTSFGLRRILNERLEYELFHEGTGFEFGRTRGRPRVIPHPAKYYGFPREVRANFRNTWFLNRLELALEECLGNVYYLGPLRAYPERNYRWSGAEPIDMGEAGEYVVDAILASGERGETILWGKRRVTLGEYVAQWLKELGLIHDFRVEPLAEGSSLFEVRVRKSERASEVLITDVGFGVSQILPVLVLCFYVPVGSTVILEQPEIHLHPAIQSGLADVLIDAWKKRKVQILLESHSEHLLHRLQRRIAEEDISRDDIGLFFCSAGGRSSEITPLELDPYGNIANWPKDFFGDQFGEIAAMSDAALRRQGASE